MSPDPRSGTVVRSFFLASLGLLASLSSIAQAVRDNSIRLQDIQLTNAPTFSLLDVSPSSIESPNCTKAFSASVLDGLAQSNGFPQNYAMEFTPFWYWSHPHYTNFRYFGMTPEGRSLPFSQIRLFALSFALINQDSATNIGKLENHNAGLGLRTTLFRIYSGKVQSRILELNHQWNLALADELNHIDPSRPIAPQLDSMGSLILYPDSIKEYLLARPLFSVDGAAASNLCFTSNSFASGRMSRTGVWLNSNLSFNLDKKEPGKDYVTFSVMTRYIYARDSLNLQGQWLGSHMVDLGFKTEFQLGNILLDYEYVHRSFWILGKAAHTYKSVGLIHYKVRDGLFLTGAFGQNFSTVNNLIATLGVNLGISNGKERLQ